MNRKSILMIVMTAALLLVAFTISAAGNHQAWLFQTGMDMPTETMPSEPTSIPETPTPQSAQVAMPTTMVPANMWADPTYMPPGMRQNNANMMPGWSATYTSTLITGTMFMGGCPMMGGGGMMGNNTGMGGGGSMSMGGMGGSMNMGNAGGTMNMGGNMNMGGAVMGYQFPSINPEDYVQESRSVDLSNPWMLLGWVILGLVVLAILVGIIFGVILVIRRIKPGSPASIS